MVVSALVVFNEGSLYSVRHEDSATDHVSVEKFMIMANPFSNKKPNSSIKL